MPAAWDEFEHDPRSVEHAALRASDLDRDVVHRRLAEAYASGRLTRAEFDEREDQALEVRTLGQIPALIEDLTATKSRAVEPTSVEERALQSYLRDRRNAVWQFLSASAICWVIWLAVSGGHWGFPWPLFVMLGTGLQAARVAYLRDEMIAEKRRSLEKGDRKQLKRERRSLETPTADEDDHD